MNSYGLELSICRNTVGRVFIIYARKKYTWCSYKLIIVLPYWLEKTLGGLKYWVGIFEKVGRARS